MAFEDQLMLAGFNDPHRSGGERGMIAAQGETTASELEKRTLVLLLPVDRQVGMTRPYGKL